MLIKTVVDEKNGRKWELYKKEEGLYFYKYYEYFKSCGWRYITRDGDHINGYLTEDCIKWLLYKGAA